MGISDSKPISDIRILSVQGSLSRTGSDTMFFLVLNGAVDFHRADAVVSASAQDVIMFGGREHFSIYGSGSNLVLSIAMRSDFFSQGQSELLGRFVCSSVEDRDRDYAPLRRLLAQLALTRFEGSDINGIHQRELAYSLVYYLNRYHYIPLFRSADNSESTQKYAKRYAQIVSFIEQNYSESISLEDLAREVFLTPTYLSRFFSKHMGENFRSYLNHVRLDHAMEDLAHTDLTLTAIAYNNGFPNLNAFSQLFQNRYGISPAQYRKDRDQEVQAAQSSVAEADPLHYTLAEKTLNEMAVQTEESVTAIRFPNQEVVRVENVQDHTPIKPIWNSIINLGYASYLNDHTLQSHLALFQREIGFRYGRIQSVLGEEFFPTLSDNENYNFSNLDRSIETLLSLGLTPFLDLTSRSNYLLLSNKDYVYATSRKPSSAELNRQLVRKVDALIRHCINTFGASEVERWIFEIGYVHGEYLVMQESVLSFVQRFEKCYRIIKDYLPNALVGGISHNFSIPVDIFRRCLDEMERIKLSPDFISLCGFPYERNLEVSGPESHAYTSNPHFLREQVLRMKEVLAQYPSLTQTLYLTAFGVDVKARNPLNDSCFQASFLALNTIDLVGLVDMVGYWQLSDIATEYTDSARILFGGSGIINKNGLKKPGFTALKRMNNLTSHLVQRGDNYIITTNTRNAYQIIVCNYVHFSDVFCVCDCSAIPVEDAYSVFTNLSTKDLTIQLDRLPPGQYKVITTTLNRDSGCLLDEWLRYGILDNLHLRDIRYFSDIVHPNRQARQMNCPDGSLELHVHMLPHEVKFFEIIREL